MKKIIRILIAVLVLIPLTASAKEGYFENVLKELGTLDYYTGSFKREGFSNWDTIRNLPTRALNLGQMLNASSSKYKFDKIFKSKALLFNDINNIKATSSNDKIISVNVNDYDFAEEKKYFEEYPKLYESYTLEEINSELADTNKYSAKPTWWAYNGFTSEPKTWYEAYGLTEEPTNAVEVETVAHDLGVAVIKITADDKDPISITWSVYQDIFYDNDEEALIEFLNNSDKYKDIIKGNQDYYTKNIYDIMYQTEEKSDISKIVNALKGKDITINFDYYNDAGYTSSYFLNGKDITTDAKEGLTYYYEATLYNSENKDAIDKLLGSDNLKIYIDFAYHGELPAKYRTGIDVYSYAINTLVKKAGCTEEDSGCYQNAYEESQGYLENEEFVLLYYNKEKNQMEVIKDGLKADSEFSLLYIDLDHFSTYVLMSSSQYNAIIGGTSEENPQTGDNILSYVTLFTMSALALGFMYKKFLKNN